ncbi:MAG: type II toxin-antitoxin system VapC family toxin [Solirubrobacteraceae bacterium]
MYLDASALVKRYVAEPGSDRLRELMGHAAGWFMCRVGYLETARAVGLAGSPSAVRAVHKEWAAFNVIEADQELVESAIELALAHDLRSLDALHLASALVLPREDLIVAVWDRRLHAAARVEGLRLFPQILEERG